METIEKIKGRSLDKIDIRVSIHEFIKEFLVEYDQAPLDKPYAYDNDNLKIWIYWAQGRENMPPIVKACISQLYLTHDERDITFLSDENIDDFIELPEYIYSKLSKNKSHFSDILRVALLSEYGGVWLDATCFCSGNITPLYEEAMKTGFFAFTCSATHKYMISSWFLAARPNNVITTLLRDALYCYWNKNDELVDYFVFHFFFEALYNLNDEFRKSWDSSLCIGNTIPHILQINLFDKYNDDVWKSLMSLSLVHKLTYKYDKTLDRAGTFLSHIEDGLTVSNTTVDHGVYNKKIAITIYFPLNGRYYNKFSYSFDLPSEKSFIEAKIPIPRSVCGKLCICFYKTQLLIEISSFLIISRQFEDTIKRAKSIEETIVKEYSPKNGFNGVFIEKSFIRFANPYALTFLPLEAESKLYLDYEFSEDLYDPDQKDQEYLLYLLVKAHI